MKSTDRDFYSSSSGNDYIGYVSKGITEARTYDYVSYMDDNDKSSGVFDSKGLLSKQDVKALRNMLRETKSCIWDMVISFEELFGKEHLFHYEQAIGLLNNILPKFFKSANLNPKNVIWYAGLHENTDNRHIHISFFEKEPTFYNHRKKEYKYHRGKIPIIAVKELKLNAENYFNSPMEELKIKRKKLVESLKLELADKSFDEFESSLKWLLKGLFEEIPRSGRTGYDSENMKPYKERIDNITTLILEKSVYKDDYKIMLDTIIEYDEKLKKKCRKYNLDENEYLYEPKFKHDLYRRMGNVLIKEIVNQREKEYKELQHIKNEKYRRRAELKKTGYLLSIACVIADRTYDEAYEVFLEFQIKMRNAEIERLIEEGILDKEELENEM
ncbi:MAG: hypothetical protein KH328_02850 [Staphylococcus sp.]|nr:hypothetical protein [Staphylococcus sp.]